MDPVDCFIVEAEAFTGWARSGTDQGADAARIALLRLTRLYLAALELPMSEGDDQVDRSTSFRVSGEESDRIYAHAARLPLDMYGEVYNPLVVPPEEPVVGSLADDIMDVYREVEYGLRLFRAGRREEALFQWRMSLQIHWGEHATGAIRALHCWLAQNDPDRLSGENPGPDASRSQS